MLKNQLLALLFVMSSSVAFAQEEEKKDDEKDDEWNVSDPYSEDWNIKEVELNTDEGTWMNLDVSPDGSQVLFNF